MLQRLFNKLKGGQESAPAERTTIAFDCSIDVPQAGYLRSALDHALGKSIQLPDEILSMRGMSGRRYWGLINHLVNFTPNAAYLEVGSWKGSTACAAMAGNQVKMQCIDDWSEYGGPKEEFFANTGRWLTPDIEFDFLEQDCNETDFGALGPFNIYFFDGPHSMPDTFNGIVNAQDALTPVHTLIMDDWNWPFVRKGTQDALDHLAHDVLATLKIRTTQDGSHPAIACEQSDWHNGYFIAVCRKQSAVG